MTYFQSNQVVWWSGQPALLYQREKKQAKSALRAKERKQPLWRLAHFIDAKGQVDNANHVENGDLPLAVHIARIAWRMRVAL